MAAAYAASSAADTDVDEEEEEDEDEDEEDDDARTATSIFAESSPAEALARRTAAARTYRAGKDRTGRFGHGLRLGARLAGVRPSDTPCPPRTG